MTVDTVLHADLVCAGPGLTLGADATVSLGDNDARHNAGWGIYVPGAVDLGGNTARHNGRSPQCVGVVCT
ncbi:hypothetical protein [Cellulomonas edaphi]|uniref:Right handed beta helix domain-containing protein n=1 Tax=Cellulomonas edaphi TaxID=3053468 RepID=A0ABT7S9P4_9CELL|nr:hypothetical protein [Cellulomons edaphi]MDM7832343.1 hypothetical protein [Cellulomons edaphi]